MKLQFDANQEYQLKAIEAAVKWVPGFAGMTTFYFLFAGFSGYNFLMDRV